MMIAMMMIVIMMIDMMMIAMMMMMMQGRSLGMSRHMRKLRAMDNSGSSQLIWSLLFSRCDADYYCGGFNYKFMIIVLINVRIFMMIMTK